MGVLRTIAIILIVYYGSKFFFRYIAPVLLTNYVKKKTEQQHGTTQTKDNIKEGTTVIDKKPSQKTPKHDLGEYVDYEEIED